MNQPFFSHLFVVVLSASIAQGLLLLLVLSRKAVRPAGQPWLAAFIATVVMLQVGRLLHALDPVPLWHHKILLVADVMIFLLTPFQFVYLRQLSRWPVLARWPNWAHFVPAVAYLLSTFPFLLANRAGYFHLLQASGSYFLAVESLGIVFNLFYCWHIWRLLRHIRAASDETLSFARHPLFFRGMLLIGPVLAFWTLNFMVGQLIHPFAFVFVAYQMVWLLMSILIFGFSYVAVVHPAWFAAQAIPPAPVPALAVNGTQIIDRQLFDALKQLMDYQKPYLDAELTLAKLAAHAHLQPYELSRLINQGTGRNFFEFVNQYRVAEFQRLATPTALRQLTILALAYQAGFNSKTTFNEAFKRMTGETPSQFLGKYRPTS